TAGIVSAEGRSLPNDNYVPFIQTDGAINPGNSGGPLVNLDGKVVGVNSQIYSRTGGFMGVSFAIPIHVVMDVYQQLRDKGSVTRGWLGVLIQDVTSELAESFGMDKPRGALVSKVLDGSPAGTGGLETGDVIVRFNGKPVDQSSDLPPMVGATRVGQAIPVEVVRAGKSRTLSVEIGALPEEDGAEVASGGEGSGKSRVDTRLGLAVTNLDEAARERLEVDKGGALIEDMDDGPARQAGLRVGDVILEFDSTKVKDAKHFRELVAALAPGRTVPVLVQRQGGPMFLALKTPAE
ncbi:MAG: PDZ domain-containing protein, partial [Gammaproteobacteria bacterium]